MVVERRDVEFEVEGGDRLRGWLFVPENRSARHPAISMAHGYAGVKEHGLERFARAFTEAGFVVLVHDHRNFGSSDGAIRHDIDPWRQIADWRRAISLLESLLEVDRDRIGVWGTSYAGGHVLVLAATDRRIQAVVAQVPTISGYEQELRRIPPENVAAIEEAFADDDRAQLRGEPPDFMGNSRRKLINCNCSYGCPCQFNALPTYGFCEAMVAISISGGYYGDVRLDGLNIAVVFQWPGPIHEGKGKCQPIVDERDNPGRIPRCPRKDRPKTSE